MNKEELKNNFLEELDGYFMQVSYLEDINLVWNDIEDHKKEMSRASQFTLIIECALMNDFMLTFTKLYDKSKKAKTIQNLIEKTEKNLDLFPSELHDDIRKKLNDFYSSLENDVDITKALKILVKYRDKILVHNDIQYFGWKQLKDESYLPMHCLWSLLYFTKQVVTYIHSLLSNDMPRKHQYNQDLKNLFQ